MAEVEKTAFRPDYTIPPGETLRETLDALGMTQAELAERAGRPKKTINEIISGKAAITPETALQLERVLGVPASFWNSLERNYQETLVRLRDEKQLASQSSWLKRFPLQAMIKAGWVAKAGSSVEQLRAILNFFGVAGIKEWDSVWEGPRAVYRASPAFQRNPAAAAAWLRKGELEGQKIACKPFSPSAVRGALAKVRALTMEPPEVFELEMKRLCADAGVAVVFVPELPGTHLYGATRWLGPNKALIQLSLRGKSDDHLWFAFFHEAAHILLHGKREVFIEAKDEGCRDVAGTDKEQQANRFAEDFLIPPESYNAFVQLGRFAERDIVDFAARVNVAPGIVVGRLQFDRVIPFSKGNRLKKRFRFSAERA